MILVTGVTGLTGSAIVREFARQNIPVRALFRSPDKARPLYGLAGVELVEGDMLRAESLTTAFHGVDRVLMISSAEKRMTETQCAFIDAAKAAGVPYMMKLSGKESGMGFDPDKFQGTREHVEIERYLEASGLAWTHLRPSQFMHRYLPGALTGVDADRRELRLPIGDIRLSPVDVEDIAKVAVALMSSDGHEGMAYDMTGPEALTMQEVVQQISIATGTTFTYVPVALEDKLREFRDMGVPEAVAQIIKDQLVERARHPDSHVRTKIQEALGVKPTSFAEFARRHAKAFLDQ